MKTVFATLQLSFVMWAVLIVFPLLCQASVIATDGFSYPDGTLSDLDGGTGAWETRWIGSGFNVVSGEVDGVNSLPVNVNTVRRHFINPLVDPQVVCQLRSANGSSTDRSWTIMPC